MAQISNFLLIAIITTLFGCATKTITLTEDMLVKSDGRFTKVSAGQTLEVSDEPVILRSLDGKHSVAIVPAMNDVKIPGRNLVDAKTTRKNEKDLNRLLSEVAEIQFLIDQSLLHEALQKIRHLRKKNRKLIHLRFLEAKVLVMLGEDEKARTILAQVLRSDPKDRKSKKLYDSLGDYDNQ